MAKFNIYTTKDITKLDIKGDYSNLDLILAIGTLFDRMSPDGKKLLISKLEKLVNNDKDTILNSEK